MIAMMFPAMIPVILFYNKVFAKAEPKPISAKLIGTPLFLAGYLATYSGLGLIAYLAVFSALASIHFFPALSAASRVAPGLVLLLAGVYQLSPLKYRCLSSCASPFGFFLRYSRKGLLGSLRMGFSHGKYCVGCCWAYMLVMFAVAAMSISFMAILAIIITLEKTIVRGAVWFNRLIAAFFLVLGVTVMFFPGLLIFV